MRLGDGECSEKFDVGHGLRQGCELAPLFDMFFTAILRLAEKRFLVDAAIMDNIVRLQRNKEKRRTRASQGRAKSTGGGGGLGGGAGVEGYAVRRRCGHRVAITRRAEEVDDNDRDYEPFLNRRR